MHGILKKKFSQNFLVDKNILNKISRLILKKNLNILEIGPGDGRLTESILNFNPNLLELIEIDSDLIPILKYKFKNFKNIKIINKDILDYSLKNKFDLLISNLPYNISSQILVKICFMELKPEKLILMFQKEFAQRLLEKKLNSINSLIKCFYEIKSSFVVSKNCFRPIPKVESSVLLFNKKNKFLLNQNEIKNYVEFKRDLFSHKRKTLNNILKRFDFDREGLDLNKRVEELDIQILIELFRRVNT